MSSMCPSVAEFVFGEAITNGMFEERYEKHKTAVKEYFAGSPDVCRVPCNAKEEETEEW